MRPDIVARCFTARRLLPCRAGRGRGRRRRRCCCCPWALRGLGSLRRWCLCSGRFDRILRCNRLRSPGHRFSGYGCRLCRFRCCLCLGRRGRGSWRRNRCSRWRRRNLNRLFRLCLARLGKPALAGLDNDSLAAAMREVLPNSSLCQASRAQRQRLLGSNAELVVVVFVISHSCSWPCLVCMACLSGRFCAWASRSHPPGNPAVSPVCALFGPARPENPAPGHKTFRSGPSRIREIRV